MLTAMAICWYLSEIAFAHPNASITSFLFLIILAVIVDYGIWQLGDS
jgi:high-affinity Fe2+/Pb2+ permease